MDKHSGYIIKNINFSDDEGYDEHGFKLNSKEQMEKLVDIGNSIIQNPNIKVEFTSPTAIMISNVVNTITKYMGINIDSQREFIIRNVLITQDQNIPSQESYDKQSKIRSKEGKKKLPPYKKMYNESLILVICAYILTAIQVSIPSVRTRKTFPGCVKSFVGFPLYGEEDMSAVNYVACIAYKLRSTVKPWDGIKSAKEDTIHKKIDQIIRKYILTNTTIQEKFAEKREYIKIEEIEFIPIEHDIFKWVNFLPPLVPIKLSAPEYITSHFLGELTKELKLGSSQQQISIGTIESKIMYFSLAIQKIIKKSIEKAKPLLINSNNEAFLENACCYESDINPYNFFNSKDKNISGYNESIKKLSDILFDIYNCSKASMLFDPEDTRIVYPELSDQFSEKTIYQAFIIFCKFNSSLPISEALQGVCISKPTGQFDIEDSIEEKIKILKEEGKDFNYDSFLRLLDIVNKENIVHLDLEYRSYNYIGKLRELLSYTKEQEVTSIPMHYQNLLSNSLDTFDISGTKKAKNYDDKMIRGLRSYINEQNEYMTNKVIDFLRTHSKMTNRKFKSIESYLLNIAKFKDTNYNVITYLRNTIRNLSRVFPNIILNKVDNSNITIPRHWKLSKTHNKDIQNRIEKYYSYLSSLYDDAEMNNIATKIQPKITDILLFVENTPYYSDIKALDDTHFFTIFNKETTIQTLVFYLYKILNEYISLSEDVELQEQDLPDNIDEPNIVSSVEIEEAEMGIINEYELLKGEKKEIEEKISEMLIHFIYIFIEDKDSIDFNIDSIGNKVLRTKEKEKDIITQNIKRMTDEEREIENMLKNTKLGKWNKGLQKGLVQYQSETYDDERNEMEKQLLSELALGKMDMVSAMNQDIYQLDLESEQQAVDEIEAEVNDLSNMHNDDDFGDNMDGDEGY